MDFLGIAQAGGVLEIRDQIGKLGIRVVLDGLGQLVAVDAVGVHRDGQDDRIENVEGLQRDQIGRVLDDDLVAGVDERGGNHGQGLLRAVGDDDVVRAHAGDAHGLIALGDPLAQGRPAGGRAVLQRGDAVFLQDLLRGGLHLGNREGNRIRKAAGKGNNIRRGSRSQNGGGKLTLKIRLGDSVGKIQFHRMYAPCCMIFFLHCLAVTR